MVSTSGNNASIFNPALTREITNAVMTLSARTARELMTPGPVMISDHSSIHEAAAVFLDKRISSVPVVDGAGNPVGVLSLTDLVRFERENASKLKKGPDYYHAADLDLPSGEDLHDGFEVEGESDEKVCEIMTPMVLAVTPEVSAEIVIAEMLARRVHRLFVVEPAGELIGVISALDILRYLE